MGAFLMEAAFETLCCERNLVERFFNIIKHFRAIATRYEQTARNVLAGVHLVCALAWLK
jgi:transposase